MRLAAVLATPPTLVSETIVRPAVDADLPLLTDLYNHYVLNTPITFDTRPFTVDERRSWFDDHAATGRHRLRDLSESENLKM